MAIGRVVELDNVFRLKTIAAKLGTSGAFGVLCGIIAPVV